MANKKITDLTDIGTPANDDLLEIVDVSDLTDSPEGTSKKVLVSALGGGSTPTLQDVRDIDPNVTVENPNDANNVGLWNSLQYNEYALRVEDGLLIETLSGNVQQVTSRFSDSATIQIQGSIYDSVTEDSLQSTLGVEQGKAIILEIINDSTLNQGSHKIELDPAIGEEVIFKTPNDATTGTETIATREWVEDNVEKIIVSKSNGTFGSHTGNTAETVLLAIDINANEFEPGDRLAFKILTDKSSNVENVQYRVRFGTTGTTADGLIATSLNFSGNNARYMMFDRQRIAFLTGNSVRAASAQIAASSDISSLSGISTSVSLNPTLAWKFVITAQLSAGAETTNLIGYTISKIKSF